MSNQFEQYRQTSIQTAPPEQLVVMLYDGALRFLEQAKGALSGGQDPSEPIGRAQDILVELAASLNRSAGEVADNLARLYDFHIHHLFRAQIRRDPQMIDEVAGMLRELREAWATVALQRRAASAAAAATMAPGTPAVNARG